MFEVEKVVRPYRVFTDVVFIGEGKNKRKKKRRFVKIKGKRVIVNKRVSPLLSVNKRSENIFSSNKGIEKSLQGYFNNIKGDIAQTNVANTYNYLKKDIEDQKKENEEQKKEIQRQKEIISKFSEENKEKIKSLSIFKDQLRKAVRSGEQFNTENLNLPYSEVFKIEPKTGNLRYKQFRGLDSLPADQAKALNVFTTQAKQKILNAISKEIERDAEGFSKKNPILASKLFSDLNYPQQQQRTTGIIGEEVKAALKNQEVDPIIEEIVKKTYLNKFQRPKSKSSREDSESAVSENYYQREMKPELEEVRQKNDLYDLKSKELDLLKKADLDPEIATISRTLPEMTFETKEEIKDYKKKLAQWKNSELKKGYPSQTKKKIEELYDFKISEIPKEEEEKKKATIRGLSANDIIEKFNSVNENSSRYKSTLRTMRTRLVKAYPSQENEINEIYANFDSQILKAKDVPQYTKMKMENITNKPLKNALSKWREKAREIGEKEEEEVKIYEDDFANVIKNMYDENPESDKKTDDLLRDRYNEQIVKKNVNKKALNKSYLRAMEWLDENDPDGPKGRTQREKEYIEKLDNLPTIKIDLDEKQEEEKQEEKKQPGDGNKKSDEGLYNTQIDKFMKPVAKTINYYGAVPFDYISDVLDDVKTKKFCFIYNKAKSTDPAKAQHHWCAVNCDGLSLEIYDPLGEDIQKDIIKILKDYVKQKYNIMLVLKTNKNKPDQKGGYNCGWYCMRFLIARNLWKVPFDRITGFRGNHENNIQHMKQNIQRFGFI